MTTACTECGRENGHEFAPLRCSIGEALRVVPTTPEQARAHRESLPAPTEVHGYPVIYAERDPEAYWVLVVDKRGPIPIRDGHVRCENCGVPFSTDPSPRPWGTLADHDCVRRDGWLEVFIGGWRVGIYKTEAGARRRAEKEVAR